MLKSKDQKIFEDFLQHDYFKGLKNKENIEVREAISSNDEMVSILATLVYYKSYMGSTKEAIWEQILKTLKEISHDH